MTFARQLRTIAWALFFLTPPLIAQAQPFQYKVGTCLEYSFLRGDNRTVWRDCITAVQDNRVTIGRDRVFDSRNRNYLTWNSGTSYGISTGLFSTAPACLPGGSDCERDLSQDTSAESWEKDGVFVMFFPTGRVNWQKFSFKSQTIDCEVLGKAERCQEGVRVGTLLYNNGGREQVRDTTRIALTGPARGHLVFFQHGNVDAPARGFERTLVKMEERSVSP